jgi:iron complex transport system substrate-binding protein
VVSIYPTTSYGRPRDDAAIPKAATRIFTDETGRRVAVPAQIRRVISLAPNLTETVYALGLQDHLVGDTIYCDYPPEARSKPHVGATLNPSLEVILALKPDLVLATTTINREDTVAALERLGIAVYVTDPHTMEQLLAGIRHLAGAMGAEAKGETLATDLQAHLDALHDKLANSPPVPVFFVVWEDPLISIGQNTFLADALRWAGGESVVKTGQNWPKIGLEEVVRLQPEYLVFPGDETNSETKILADLRDNPGFRNLYSVKKGNVAVISESIDRPAPRLVGAIEQLAKKLHPDVFAAPPGVGGANSHASRENARNSDCSSGAALCSH